MIEAVVIRADALEAARLRVRQRTSAPRRTQLLSLAWLVQQIVSMEQALDPACRRVDVGKRLGLTEREMTELAERGDALPESRVRVMAVGAGVAPERITAIGRPALRSLVAAPDEARFGALRSVAATLAASSAAKADRIVGHALAGVTSACSAKQAKSPDARAVWRRWATWLAARLRRMEAAVRRRASQVIRLLCAMPAERGRVVSVAQRIRGAFQALSAAATRVSDRR